MNYNPLIEAVASGVVIRATKFVSPTEVIRATRIRFNKKILNDRNIAIRLTIGRPNYLDREFIKLCKKANEPFPIKKIQYKLYISPKKKLERRKV